MRCRVCSSDDRSAIEAAIDGGATIAEVVDRYGLSERALSRHIASHPRVEPSKTVPAPKASGKARRERAVAAAHAALGSSARAELDAIRGEVKMLLAQVRHADVPFADKDRALRTALSAIRLLGNMTGELGASDSMVAASPFYRRVRTLVLEALAPHPDALRAVVDALKRAEQGSDEPGEVAA